MEKIKSGDIMKGNWDMRIVTAVNEVDCWYVDYDKQSAAGYFYNPCKACVSLNAMKKYEKVGEIPKEVMDKLLLDLTNVISAHNEAFMLLEREINGNSEYDINQFITIK